MTAGRQPTTGCPASRRNAAAKGHGDAADVDAITRIPLLMSHNTRLQEQDSESTGSRSRGLNQSDGMRCCPRDVLTEPESDHEHHRATTHWHRWPPTEPSSPQPRPTFKPTLFCHTPLACEASWTEPSPHLAHRTAPGREQIQGHATQGPNTLWRTGAAATEMGDSAARMTPEWLSHNSLEPDAPSSSAMNRAAR